jgi:hypothetical protein
LATVQNAAALATAYGLRGRNGVVSSAPSGPVSPKHSLDAALDPNSFQNVQCRDGDTLDRFDRLLKGQADRALSTQIVDLAGRRALDHLDDTAEVCWVCRMEAQLFADT